MISLVKEDSELFELSEVLLDFYKLMPYKQETDDHKTCTRFCTTWRSMIDSGSAAILALKKLDTIIGGIGLIFFPALEDGEMTCTEAFWYVRESERGGGLKLLLSAQKFAKENGAKRMNMIHLSHLMPEKLKNLYNRLGFREIETTYLKEL
jgi:GNAT superfamily N-acetyltransferase